MANTIVFNPFTGMLDIAGAQGPQGVPGSGSAFDGDRPITSLPTVGFNAGTITDLVDWVNAVFFRARPPLASLSGGNTRELGSSPALSLSFNATKVDNPITLITITSPNGTVTPSGTDTTIPNGINIVPTGNTQSGSRAATAEQDVSTTFTLTVGDGSTSPTAQTSVSWLSKRYWGKFPTFTAPTDGEILALTGAGVGTGNELANSYNKSYNGINGAGEYLMFAWPTAFGTSPTFTVNGLPNTAFTKIRSNSPFTNASGYTRNYDVWISNTPQFSPIALFQVS